MFCDYLLPPSFQRGTNFLRLSIQKGLISKKEGGKPKRNWSYQGIGVKNG
jgi:hypothetical protein